MRCYRRLLNISYKDHVTNEEVRNRIHNATGVHDDLLTMVKKQKLRRYGHISRSSGMAKTILQRTVKGVRRRGRQKRKWEDNIKEWTEMGFEDSGEQGRMERYCCNVICGAPTTSNVKGLRWDEMCLWFEHALVVFICYSASYLGRPIWWRNKNRRHIRTFAILDLKWPQKRS